MKGGIRGLLLRKKPDTFRPPLTQNVGDEMRLVWSNGGGTQSAAIAVLIAQGKLAKPDCILMADTGREASTTWDYLEKHIDPILSTAGLHTEIVPHSYATVDLYGKKGDLLIPAFTANGKLPTFCSNEWKQRPIRRRMRELGYDEVILWLGITVDESHRMKPSGVDWIMHHWPLAWDLHLRRSDCIQIVLDAGLPYPPRSSCWMCPHRRNSEWMDLSEEDFSKASLLDDEIRLKDSSGVWLHESRTPLGQVDFTERQLDLFDGCEAGYCMV